MRIESPKALAAEQQNILTCMRGDVFLSYRKRRRDGVLRKMAAMRAAKERKRLENPPPEPEPKMQRWYRFEFGVRDKVTGQTEFVDLRSVRHAAKALGLILNFY